MYIDTHTHLFSKQFNADRAETIQRALDMGVTTLLLPNIDEESLPRMLECAKDFPACKPMIGVHPCSINANYQSELNMVARELDRGGYIAVGEIGLDYYWDITFKEEQKEAFRQQILWAKQHHLPIAIHTRNSFEDAFEIVASLNDADLKGVFHCFSGTMEDAEKIMSLGGFYMGIGGVLTFKNGGIDGPVREIPLEYLVLETDAPYLAPVPHRGKRNESAYLPIIAERLAAIKQVGLESIAQQTSLNAQKLFNL